MSKGSWLVALEMDAVGFGVLEFSLAGFFGSGPNFALVIRRIEGGAVFAVGVGLIVDAFHVEAAFADPGVALLFVDWPPAVAELARTHF